MNLTVEIINGIKDLINANDSLDDESKKFYLGQLDSGDNTNVLNSVERFIISISNSPVIKKIWSNHNIIDIIFICVHDKEDEYSVKKSLVFQNLGSQIDLNEFFSNDYVIEKIRKEGITDFNKIFNGFLDFFPEPLKSEFVEQHINEAGKSLRELSRLPESYFKRELSKQETFNAIFEELKKDVYCFEINETNERIIWNTYKEKISEMSLSYKLRFFQKVENKELKQEIFSYLSLNNEIENVDDYTARILVKYISQEDIYNLFLKCTKESEYDKYLGSMDSEHQLKALKFLISKKINVFKPVVFSALNTNVKERLIELNPGFASIEQLYELYKDTKDVKFMQQIKEKLMEEDQILVSQVLFEDDFIRFCSPQELDVFISKINGLKFLNFPEDNLINYNDAFLKKYIEQIVNFCQNNPNELIIVHFDKYKKYFTNAQQDIIINNIKLDNWLSEVLNNSEIFNFFVSLLKKKPEILNKFDLKGISLSISIKDELVNRIDELLIYFSEDNLELFYSDEVLAANEKLRNKFLESAKNNPNLINSKQKFRLFSIEERRKLIMTLPVKLILSLLNDNNPEFDYIAIVSKRLKDIIDYFNDQNLYHINNLISDVYIRLTSEEQEYFVNHLTNLNVLDALFKFLSHEEKQVEKEFVLSHIISTNRANMMKYIYNKSQDYFRTNSNRLDIKEYRNEDLQMLIDKADITMLMYILTYYNSDAIIKRIVELTRENYKNLLNPEILSILTNSLAKFPDQLKREMEQRYEQIVNENELYLSVVKPKAKNLSLLENLKFMYLFENNQLIGFKLEMFKKLLNKNPFVLTTLNPILFEDNIALMDEHFIDKTSKYEILQLQLEMIVKSNIGLSSFLKKASDYLLENEHYEAVYDKKISMLITYLANDKSKLKDYDFTQLDNLEDLINYILHDYTNTESVYIYGKPDEYFDYKRIEETNNFAIYDFTNQRISKCDELFYASKDLNEMKNMYFNKFLSISLYDAVKFKKKYMVHYDKVKEYSTSDAPLTFLEIIDTVISIDDPRLMKEIYEKSTKRYSLGDYLTIESIIQDSYTSEIAKSYIGRQKGNLVSKTYKDKEGNDVNIELTELFNDFGILVHSTCAYGEMPLLDNDYFISWNNNPNTTNHGICCSYITNSSYGTASVKGNGVMFGFLNINSHSIATYSPYDLATVNNGYNITSQYVPHYVTLEDMPNFTRHTHNEVDLERRNDTLENRFNCIQPDCIIILEEMSDEIKANSLKAYEDFKKHGVDLKLFYFDRTKNSLNEAEKIKTMMMEYYGTYDFNKLAELINIYESNLCSCTFIDGIDKDETFMTLSMEKLLADTISFIASTPIQTDRIKLAQSLEEVLDREQYKFNLLNDRNKKRARKFELYTPVIREQIRMLKGEGTNLESRKVM